MTRFARIVLPGWAHHVTQRGNHRQTVFFSDNDRLVYLRLLAKYMESYEIMLIAYCLMGNHVHLVPVPGNESSLADGIGRLHHDFAVWQNMRLDRSGHLWQNRFFSCLVEEDRIGDVVSYIESNPVRAHLVGKAWDWEWSSARAHVTGEDPTGLLDMNFWRKRYDPEDWKEILEQAAAQMSMHASIRRATTTGRFLGCEATARQLEQQLGRLLLPRKKGRKRRSPPTV